MLKPGSHQTEVFYPDSDDQPLESELHRDLMIELIDSLKYHFRDDPEFYVTGNLFVYYKEGDPKKVVGPDVFVVRGIATAHRRPLYKIWEEGKGPELAIELTSPTTHRRDKGPKREIYEFLGVKEYYIFDPIVTADWVRLDPPLRGYRLRDGVLEAVAPIGAPDGTFSLTSDLLGLELHTRGESLKFVDPLTGRTLPTRAEAERQRAEAERQRAEAERERAAAERERVRDLEAELARLREESSRLRGDE